MKLYHGTNADIDAIDLNRGMLHKDFGKGFYLTSVSVLPIFLRLRARRGFSAGHCPLYREWRKGRFRELLKAALLLL